MRIKLSLAGVLLSLSVLAVTHNVTTSGTAFSPANITINQGDTVVWTNGGGSHNVNGTQATFPSNPASFGNSVGTGWTYQFVFTTAGTYNYQCDPHAGLGMVGTVTVNAVVPVAPVAQSFETTGGTWSFTTAPASYNISGDVWDTVSTLSSISASQGSNFWGMQDLDNPNGGGAFAHTIDFEAVDVSGLTNGVVSFDYYTIGFESSDSIGYYVEFDNGTTWTTYVDLNKDTQAWTNVSVPVPSGSTYARLRILAAQNGATDYAAIDNFKVDVAAPIQTGIPTYNIAQIHGVDATTGDADSVGTECKLVGVVHSIDFTSGAGYSFYMYDATGGINIYKSSDVGTYTTPAIGDSIRIIGTIAQFRGLIEIVPDSIVVLNTGVTLKSPASYYNVNESNEGDYIKLNGFWVINPSSWPATGSSATVSITNGTDTVDMRIDSDTDIDGSPAPSGSFSVVGAASQYDFNAPYLDSYQFLPSSLADFMASPASTIPVYNIADVTTNDVQGVADSLGVYCELRGTAFTIDFDGNSGYSFFMYDATGGINVYHTADVNNYTMPHVGDSIRAFGTIAQYKGLTELDVDSIILVGTGKTLKTPMLVADVDESTESEFIELNGWSVITPSQWPASGSSKNVDISNGVDTIVMRIDSDTDIDGTPVPTTSFDVFGAGGQFASGSTPPFLDGYQFQPGSIADFTFAAPTTPTVNFMVSSQTEKEDVGTVTVELNINPVSATNDTIFLQAMLGANVDPATDGFITPLPDLTTGLFEIPVPAGADSVSFTITVLDDAVIEGNETLFVNVVGLSAGLISGTGTSYELIIEDNDMVIPHFTIASITTVDADGIADSLNVSGMIEGVVYTDDFDGNSGYSFFMYDATGGLNVFEYDDLASGYQVNRGDSIRVYGWVDQYNGLIEFRPDSIQLLASGVALKTPLVVANVDESTEGEYIRLNGFSLVDPAQWPAAGSNANVDMTNGIDTIVIRVDVDTDIDGSPAPTGTFDIIGAGGQFDGSNPYTEGYQIQPRDINDIILIPVTAKLAITEIMPASGHTDATIDGDWFEVTNYGPATVDLMGYSWDDDSREAGTHSITGSYMLNSGESVVFLDEPAANEANWLATWKQGASLKVIYNDDFGNLGFSGLGKSGDEVNLYDADSNLVSSVAYTAATDGFSIEIDTNGIVLGNSVVGVNGAYASDSGDVGSPGNLDPISIKEFLANEYKVYPVPASSVLTLATETTANKEITLTSVTGVVVYRTESTDKLVNISINNLPKGTYILSFQSEGRTAARKVIVQ